MPPPGWRKAHQPEGYVSPKRKKMQREGAKVAEKPSSKRPTNAPSTRQAQPAVPPTAHTQALDQAIVQLGQHCQAFVSSVLTMATSVQEELGSLREQLAQQSVNGAAAPSGPPLPNFDAMDLDDLAEFNDEHELGLVLYKIKPAEKRREAVRDAYVAKMAQNAPGTSLPVDDPDEDGDLPLAANPEPIDFSSKTRPELAALIMEYELPIDPASYAGVEGRERLRRDVQEAFERYVIGDGEETPNGGEDEDEETPTPVASGVDDEDDFFKDA